MAPLRGKRGAATMYLEKKERRRRQAVVALAAPGCPNAEARSLFAMAQHVPAGEGSSGAGCSPVPIPCPGSPTMASPQDPAGPVPLPSEQTKAAYRDKVVALTAKIGKLLENARSLSQSNDRLRENVALQKAITLSFSREIRRLEEERNKLRNMHHESITKLEMANKIIKELIDDKVNLQEKYMLLQEETFKSLRERIDETKEATEAYKERNRCLAAMKAMKEDMRRETVIIEGVKKENEELKGKLEAYRALSKTDSQ